MARRTDGTLLALGAVGLLSAIPKGPIKLMAQSTRLALVAGSQARRRGARAAEQRAVQQIPPVLPVQAVDDLYEELDKARGYHRGGRKGEEWYEFNIKAWAPVPGWVEDFLSQRRIWDIEFEEAQDTLGAFVENLQEDYPWVGSEWWQRGRSGGWLALQDTERARQHLDEMSGYVRQIQLPTRTVYDLRSVGGEDLWQAYLGARRRVTDLAEIRHRVQQGVEWYERHVSSDEFWRELIENNPGLVSAGRWEHRDFERYLAKHPKDWFARLVKSKRVR